MNNAWLFHECDVELCGDPTNYSSVVSREARRWGVCMCSAPEVVAGIRQEVGFGLVEVGGRAAVLLRKNDFVKQLDLGIFARSAFAFVDELVERLSLLQCSQVLHVFRWLSLHKLLHLELIVHARLLAVATGWHKVATVRVQQAGEASHERCTHLIGSESRRADDANRWGASCVDVGGASCVGSAGAILGG